MTTQNLKTILKMLAVSFLMTSCNVNKLPPITLVQIDAVNNQANEFHIKKYNNKTCKIETEDGETFQVVDFEQAKINDKLHGGFWISADDLAKLKVYGKTECENAKKNQNNNP